MSILACALVPAAANASNASTSLNTLTYQASAGEDNAVTVAFQANGAGTSDDRYLITDAGHKHGTAVPITITPGINCAPNPGPLPGSSVSCVATTITQLVVNLDDNDDSVTFSSVDASDFATVDGGAGDDTLNGTPNGDVLRGALGDDELDGMDGND